LAAFAGIEQQYGRYLFVPVGKMPYNRTMANQKRHFDPVYQVNTQLDWPLVP
jgi:hypothetical protein